MRKSAKQTNPSLLRAYVDLRRGIGFIGIGLPSVLMIGNMVVDGPEIQNSISAYYHTPMRNIFVGGLCAIAMFLWFYRGYDLKDRIAGMIAGGSGLGVALVPTWPKVCDPPICEHFGTIHAVFSACFFVTLAFFCLYLFRKKAKRPTRRKELRNDVYAVCGLIILACIGLIFIVWKFSVGSEWQAFKPTFWLESLAVMAFGVAWTIKGETILRDP